MRYQGIMCHTFSHRYLSPHASQGKAPYSCIPIMPAILHRLKAVWKHSEPSFKAVMLWAASTVTFLTFCRSGETMVSSTYDPSTHLSLSNLVVNRAVDPTVNSLNIKQSKTDQGRISVKVIVGRTGDDICLVSTLSRYLTRRGSKPGALFICEDGSPLTKTKFVVLSASILNPFNTCRRHGISTWGSPSPCEICSCRIPDRYPLMEL